MPEEPLDATADGRDRQRSPAPQGSLRHIEKICRFDHVNMYHEIAEATHQPTEDERSAKAEVLIAQIIMPPPMNQQRKEKAKEAKWKEAEDMLLLDKTIKGNAKSKDDGCVRGKDLVEEIIEARKENNSDKPPQQDKANESSQCIEEPFVQ